MQVDESFYYRMIGWFKDRVHFSSVLQDSGEVNTTQLNINKKKVLKTHVFAPCVGLPGFEPGMTGPESVVLPLHHSPLF